RLPGLRPGRQEQAVTATAPAAPPLDAGLDQLLRRMRLPHMRRIAPEVLATARAQRWEPAEVLRALLAEEVAGRDRSSLATRRARAAFPTGKTFDASSSGRCSTPSPSGSRLARQQKMTHADFLELVLADEHARREAKSASLGARAAGLDPGMRLDTWDGTAAIRYD
ncbi:MAG: hypothetical protein ACM3ML_27340, partial [Micromonosporaceae bacterium]